MAEIEDKMADASLEDTNVNGSLADPATTNGNAIIKDEEAAQRARDAGWAVPENYDYQTYNATTLEERIAAEAKVAERAGTDENASTTQDVPLWASNAAKYEWSEEYGDIGPAFEELEKQLFRSDLTNRVGLNFDAIAKIGVTVESVTRVNPVIKFENAGLHPIMLQNVKLCGYGTPTPIQAYCLPAILTNHDVIAVAQTGSGKTAAFLIPTISKLMGKAKKLAAPRPNLTTTFNVDTDGVRAEPLILVVVPTRELAVQIFDEARRLCYRSMLRPCVAYGGAPARDQVLELRKGCDVLIATPGRLIDFMSRGHLLSLHRLKYTIIDEADELVGPDWMDDMKKIMSGGDNNEDADHNFMMFSATFPKDARQLAKTYLSEEHIRIRVGRAGSSHQNIKQTVIFVEEPQKKQCLYDLLMSMPPARTIVFVNGKKSADFLDDYLYNKGLPSTSIHSDRTQREREDALRAFRSGKAPILVATGVSARGLDIRNVMHVVNYEMPSQQHGGIQEYTHRIGRTARIGNIGVATSFYNDRSEDIADDLVKVLLECNQVVPDFLEAHKPEEGAELDFDDESDKEGEDGDAAGGDGWGDAPEASTGAAASAWEPAAATEDDDDGGW